GRAAVEGDVGAAVVRVDHALRVVGIDPEVVVVAVGHADRGKSLARVARTKETGVQNVDRFGVLRIRVDARVVPGALPQLVLRVRSGPFFSRIVGAVDAALVLGLDDRPDTIGARGGKSDADVSDNSFG